MAYRYRPVDRDRVFLLPPDMRDWLPRDHVVWFLIEVIERLDLSRFEASVTPRGSAAGRAAYAPRMLLTLLVYAYAGGVFSSRRIERLCGEDLAFRVICAQDPPDHVTLARFRRRHFADGPAMEGFFTEVLALAARAGLGRLGTVALDGTKIAANASAEANRNERRLRELAQRMLAEAERTDAAEDELFGAARGDELPGELVDPVTRAQRISKALAELQAERRAAEAAQQAQASQYLQRQGAAGRPPSGSAVEAARRRLADAEAAQQAKIDRFRRRSAEVVLRGGRPGRSPVPVAEHAAVRRAAESLVKAEAKAAAAAKTAEAKAADGGPRRNITDPDSRLMPVRGGGFIQGYNAQAVFSQDGIALATRVTQDTGDVTSYRPMTQAAVVAGRLIRRHARTVEHRRAASIGLVLADAGYLSHDNLTSAGPDRLIAVGKHRTVEHAARHDPATGPPPRHADPISAMSHRLRTPEGVTAYRQRGPLVEGPFGNHKHNRGFRRFTMRGLARVDGEWAFCNAVGNLLKLQRTGWRPSNA